MRFTASTFWSLFVLVIALILASSRAHAQRDPIRLTHGPMLGNPTAHSVTVWGRTSDAGTFSVKYGTDPGELNLDSSPATTLIEHDNTGTITLEDLRAEMAAHLGLDTRTCLVPALHPTRSTSPNAWSRA